MSQYLSLFLYVRLMIYGHKIFPVMCLAKWNLDVCFQFVDNESRRPRPFNKELLNVRDWNKHTSKQKLHDILVG